MNDEPIIFLVDDDADLREALRWLLESDGMTAECYASAESFLEAYDPERPGVLVLDVRMRGMSGIDLLRHLSDIDAEIPVIMLTGHGDVPMAVDSLKCGAIDFLQKPVHDQVLLGRIRDAVEIDARNRLRGMDAADIRSRMKTLTPREREVMDMVVSGMANKTVAHELCVSEKTIEVHRKRVMKKMDVRSAVELVRAVLAVGRQPTDQ